MPRLLWNHVKDIFFTESNILKFLEKMQKIPCFCQKSTKKKKSKKQNKTKQTNTNKKICDS